jgi:hypothetical protein
MLRAGHGVGWTLAGVPSVTTTEAPSADIAIVAEKVAVAVT